MTAVSITISFNSTEIDHNQLQKKLLARNDMRDRRRYLQDVLQTPQSPSATQEPPQSKNPRRKAKKEEYTVVSPTTDARESELTQTMPASTLKQQLKQFKISPNEKVAPAPPAKPAAQEGKKKPLVPPVKNKPTAKPKDPVPEPFKLPVNDKRNNPLPPTPPESSPTRASGPGPSPKSGRPKVSPRVGGGGNGKTPSSSSLSPSWTDQKQTESSPTSLSPPPQEQAVYENTDFSHRGKGKNKKLPPTPSPRPSGRSPTAVTPDPAELDVGGQDVYENTAFGDTSENPDLYANVPVSQQRKKKAHNGHHSPHAPPYQNVGRDDPAADSSGMAYENIHYPSNRGSRRK